MLLAVSYGRNLHHGTWRTLQGRVRYKPPARTVQRSPTRPEGRGCPVWDSTSTGRQEWTLSHLPHDRR